MSKQADQTNAKGVKKTLKVQIIIWKNLFQIIIYNYTFKLYVVFISEEGREQINYCMLWLLFACNLYIIFHDQILYIWLSIKYILYFANVLNFNNSLVPGVEFKAWFVLNAKFFFPITPLFCCIAAFYNIHFT